MSTSLSDFVLPPRAAGDLSASSFYTRSLLDLVSANFSPQNHNMFLSVLLTRVLSNACSWTSSCPIIACLSQNHTFSRHNRRDTLFGSIIS